MADGLEGINEKSLKRAQAYAASMERAQKVLTEQVKLTGKITSNLLGVDGSTFYRDLTSGELAAKTQALNAQAEQYKATAKTQGEALGTVFNQILENSELNNKSLEQMAISLELSSKQGEILKKYMGENGKLTGNLVDLIAEMGEGGQDFSEKILKATGATGDLKDKFIEGLDKIQETNDLLEETKDRIDKANVSTFDLAKGFAAVGQNISKKVLASVIAFDDAIKKAQIDTGINFTENTTQMALLTSETAKFGLSAGETAALMGSLGSELRTANFDVLSEAAGDLAAMAKATGLAAADTGKLAKEFMLFGQSSKDVADYSADVMNQARIYGVSGKEIMGEIAANLSKMRTMGFVGGEQSLARMALEAKRLGMSIDDVFSVAKKARSIEGAMEMAAELQLAGGSFAQIDPMQLLSAARKGPEEMQKILAQMGSDVGAWNEENGKYEFDPIDSDRLQMVADSTGMSMDSLTNMIAKNAEDVKKADLFGGFGASLDGLTEEQKAFIMNATKIGEGGELELAAEVSGVGDIKDLAKMSQESIVEAMKAEADKKKSLEEQAQQNMSFTESFEALKNSFMNIFAVFQPALQFIADALNKFNSSLPAGVKMVIAGIIGVGAIIFSSAKAIMQGINMAKGFQIGMQGGSFFGNLKSSLKSALPFGKGAATGDVKQLTDVADKGGAVGGASSGAGAGLMGLAEGLKAMGNTSVFKGILAMALLGPALILFLPAIPGLLLLAVLGLLAVPMLLAFNALSEGMGIMGDNLVPIAKGALAMGVLSLGLAAFAGAAYIMSQVDWLNVLAGVGVAALVVLGLIGLGFAMSGLGFVFLAIGIAALVAAGIGLLIAAGTLALAGKLLLMAIDPLEKIIEIDWTGLGGFAAAISQFGLGTVFAAVGLFAGAVALAASAPLLAMSVEPLAKISQTDWSGLGGFANGLLLLGPSMLVFAASGLLLFNPLMVLGMYTMFTALGSLGSIMQTLGPNLEQGASGIERMAEGIVKLEQSVSNLDTDKLSSLRNLAFSFAAGGASMSKMTAALSGGRGEGGSERKVVHVVQLQLDGKMLKEIELRDNKHRI